MNNYGTPLIPTADNGHVPDPVSPGYILILCSHSILGPSSGQYPGEFHRQNVRPYAFSFPEKLLNETFILKPELKNKPGCYIIILSMRQGRAIRQKKSIKKHKRRLQQLSFFTLVYAWQDYIKVITLQEL
jgi:hypothetical protein